MKKHDQGAVLRLPIPDGAKVWALPIDGQQVPVIYSAEWERQARELSDYIKGLPLPRKENDRLVALMREHYRMTAQEVYASGYEVGWQSARGGYDGGSDGP